MNSETMNMVITSVVVPVLVALVVLLQQYLSAKGEALRASVKDERLKKYIDIANDAVMTAVGAVGQTMVDGLKRAAADGILSEDEATQAFNAAKDASLAIMGTAGREAVKELYGDFDAWLIGKIEFYVGKTKSATFI